MNLNNLRLQCNELRSTCHKNINRICELTVKHTNLAEHLQSYLKMCLVIESLCNYINNCCCNAESVSKNMLNELNSQCKSMSKKCKDLHKHLNNSDSNYIRCVSIMKQCDKMCLMCSSKKSNKK